MFDIRKRTFPVWYFVSPIESSRAVWQCSGPLRRQPAIRSTEGVCIDCSTNVHPSRRSARHH